MLTVTKRFTFEACHNLPLYDGKCARLHGHSYILEVTVSGRRIIDKDNPKYGMIIDFKDLKRIVNENVIEKVDHSNLNDIFEYSTDENMVVEIFNTIKNVLPTSLKLVSCKLWETADSYAEYTGED